MADVGVGTASDAEVREFGWLIGVFVFGFVVGVVVVEIDVGGMEVMADMVHLFGICAGSWFAVGGSE